MNHQTPCKHCAPEFGRLAVALRDAEIRGHQLEEAAQQLERARAELVRLSELCHQQEAKIFELENPGESFELPEDKQPESEG